MHEEQAGKTPRRAGEALQTRAQREMLAFVLLHRQFSYRVLIGRKMMPIGTCLVRVVTRDAKGCEEAAKFEELRILPGTNDICECSARVMIDRMPQPPRPRFGPDITPHFIQLDGALWPAAADA